MKTMIYSNYVIFFRTYKGNDFIGCKSVASEMHNDATCFADIAQIFYSFFSSSRQVTSFLLQPTRYKTVSEYVAQFQSENCLVRVISSYLQFFTYGEQSWSCKCLRSVKSFGKIISKLYVTQRHDLLIACCCCCCCCGIQLLLFLLLHYEMFLLMS